MGSKVQYLTHFGVLTRRDQGSHYGKPKTLGLLRKLAVSASIYPLLQESRDQKEIKKGKIKKKYFAKDNS